MTRLLHALLRSTGAALVVGTMWGAQPHAQELEPRAYSVSPYGVNFLVVSLGRSIGDVAFDPSLPLEDVTATVNTLGIGYLRSLNVLGRSANVTVSLPVLNGTLEGIAFGEPAKGTRRGQGDPRFRFAINLVGAPAMDCQLRAGHDPRAQPCRRVSRWPVRRQSVHQPRIEPLGVQAGTGSVEASRSLVCRPVRRRVALHGERRLCRSRP